MGLNNDRLRRVSAPELLATTGKTKLFWAYLAAGEGACVRVMANKIKGSIAAGNLLLEA